MCIRIQTSGRHVAKLLLRRFSSNVLFNLSVKLVSSIYAHIMLCRKIIDSLYDSKPVLIISYFNSADLGECLNDEPSISLNSDTNMPPGALYDADYQCNAEYPGKKACKQDPEKFCKRLMCQTDPETCSSHGDPPADGTKCGENKVIYFLTV